MMFLTAAQYKALGQELQQQDSNMLLMIRAAIQIGLMLLQEHPSVIHIIFL